MPSLRNLPRPLPHKEMLKLLHFSPLLQPIPMLHLRHDAIGLKNRESNFVHELATQTPGGKVAFLQRRELAQLSDGSFSTEAALQPIRAPLLLRPTRRVEPSL